MASLISLGADPEFMLIDKEGQYHSAIDIVPGTKKDPLPLGNGHFAFWDNVLAECCPKYGKSKTETLKNFGDCFQRYAKVVNPFILKPQASQVYPKSCCTHPGALEFGCDPEMNSYDMVTVLAPVCAKGNTFRSGGGHVHLGHVEGNNFPLMDLMGRWWTARFMDFFLGIPSILMDSDPTSHDRRRLYGGAGNMRPKDYGIEYRTLSNFWLASPTFVSIIWDLCEFTVKFLQTSKTYDKIWGEYSQEVRSAINEGNKEAAEHLLHTVLVEKCHMPSKLITSITRSPKEVDFYSEWNIKI